MRHITLKETDRVFPIFDMIENMWFDDLTDDRIQEVVNLLDSWRVTDANGKLIKRAGI